jgi:hypothetical protein
MKHHRVAMLQIQKRRRAAQGCLARFYETKDTIASHKVYEATYSDRRDGKLKVSEAQRQCDSLGFAGLGAAARVCGDLLG